MRRMFLLIICCGISLNSATGQRVLTLDESISIALRESYSMQNANLTLSSQQKNLRATKLGLLSTVDLSLDLPRYNRLLSQQFNPISQLTQFYQIGETRLEGRLAINQPLIVTNGTFSIIGSLFGRDQFSEIRGTNRDYYTNVALQLVQPLFTPNSQQLQLRQAELNLDRATGSYSKARLDIVYNVTLAFYNLYRLTQRAEIAGADARQREDSYNTAVNKFKAGVIPEVEMLKLEVELASSRNDLLNRMADLDAARNSFKVLIGLPIDEEITVAVDTTAPAISIDSAKAIREALANRVELKNADIDRQLREIDVTNTRAQRSFKANLIANYGLSRNDERVQDVFHDFNKTRSVVLTVSLPIWDWGRNRTATEAAEANLRNAEITYANQEKQIVQEVLDLLNRIRLAQSRLEVTRKGEELAEKSYAISVERFKAGSIKSDELVQEQRRLTDAKINSLNALFDLKIALSDLTRKTFWDFEKNVPVKTDLPAEE